MNLRLPRLQFSLRTLVILVVIVAALASWHGSRYARARARVAALAELKAYGVELLTAEQAGALSDNPLAFLPPEESLVRNWDSYWFGVQSAEEYPLCQFNFSVYQKQCQETAPPDLASMLAHFPEIITITEPTHFNLLRSTSAALKRLSPAAAQVRRKLNLAFARLPRLNRLEATGFGLADDAWAESLPQRSSLHTMYPPNQTLGHLKIYLGESPLYIKNPLPELAWTSAGLRRLLDKAPNLTELSLNYEALDAELVARLNQSETWRGVTGATSNNAGEDKPRLLVYCDLLKPPQPTCLAELQRLDARHTLFVKGNFYNSYNDAEEQKAPFEAHAAFKLSGATFETLECRSAWQVTVSECPRLRQLNAEQCLDLQVANCAQLTSLRVQDSDRCTIETNPRLAKCELHCDQASVRDCLQLEELTYSSGSMQPNKTSLSLARLPQLKRLYFRGGDLQVEAAPALELIDFDYAQSRRHIPLLKQLPNLRSLEIELPEPPDDPDSMLPHLAELPHLENLHVSAIRKIAPRPYPKFIADLRALRKLRILWAEDFEALHAIDPARDGGITYLPPQLEILIMNQALKDPQQRAILARHHPQLLIIEDRTKLGDEFRIASEIGFSGSMVLSFEKLLRRREELKDLATPLDVNAAPASSTE